MFVPGENPFIPCQPVAVHPRQRSFYAIIEEVEEGIFGLLSARRFSGEGNGPPGRHSTWESWWHTRWRTCHTWRSESWWHPKASRRELGACCEDMEAHTREACLEAYRQGSLAAFLVVDREHQVGIQEVDEHMPWVERPWLLAHLYLISYILQHFRFRPEVTLCRDAPSRDNGS